MISLDHTFCVSRAFPWVVVVPEERSEPPLVVTTEPQRQLLPPAEHTPLPHIYPGRKIE
jgi:hypothetical protein